jgi:hypothetical protein
MINVLPDSPLDIIGDVHGESTALERLLFNLGYQPDGYHPQGRKLVFVGDLFDRGPDSPAVLKIVRPIIESGHGQLVLGNHELNLLRGERKDGNDWFWDESSRHDSKYEPYARLSESERQNLLSFLSQMPLLLERDDIRIVHAAWHDESRNKLAAVSDNSLANLFDHWDQEVNESLANSGLLQQSQAELDQWGHALKDSSQLVPLLRGVGLCDERKQMDNPLRVLSSGFERLAKAPFFSSGKWRFASRVKWWDEYQSDIPAVVGHYWRQFQPVDRKALGKGDSYLFSDVEPTHWHGARGNVFCVDFSVGGRFQERSAGKSPGASTKLAALQWPERRLVLDTGERVATGGFGGA